MSLRTMSAALALLLAGCGKVPDAAVEDAWVRLPAVAGRPGAAYFHLRAGAKPITLLKVSTPAAIRTELHESMTRSSGMMSMAPIAQLAVPASDSIDFAPGGKHVMLFDVSPSLKPGTTAKLTLSFADGTTMDTQARVVGAGDAPPTRQGKP